jgi:hypothetical protein
VKSFGFDGLYQKGGLDGSSVEEEELPEDVSDNEAVMPGAAIHQGETKPKKKELGFDY